MTRCMGQFRHITPIRLYNVLFLKGVTAIVLVKYTDTDTTIEIEMDNNTFDKEGFQKLQEAK